jgi:hypothetical protein
VLTRWYLSVALSRQKSFLLVVGDINVTGPVERQAPAVGGGDGRGGRGGGRSGGGRRGGRDGRTPRATDYFQVVRGDGSTANIRAVALRGALLKMHEAGRVFTFAV